MFEIGDKVRIRKDCTIGELVEDKWNKAHYDTLEFLTDVENLDGVYVVQGVSEKRRNAVIITDGGNELYVNYKLLEIVEKKPLTEKFAEDLLHSIAKLVGYEISTKKIDN